MMFKSITAITAIFGTFLLSLEALDTRRAYAQTMSDAYRHLREQQKLGQILLTGSQLSRR